MLELVSAIITTYRRPMDILMRAVNSIKEQSYKNIEIIIINDYPAYKDLINDTFKCDETIHIFHNDVNRGACYSRNRGIEEAKGSFIAFLDDDDVWVKDKILLQLKAMKNDIDLVYCSGVNIKPTGETSNMPFIHDCSADPIATILCGNCMGGCSFPLIRTDVLRKVGGFDENLKSSQDYDLWIRIVQKYKIAFIPSELVLYFISSDAITSNVDRRLQGYETVLNKHKELFKKHPVSATMFLNNMIGVCVANRYYGKALKYYVKSFSYFPHNHYITRNWAKVLIRKIK